MKPLLEPYLHFNGNCREAMEFYRSILGGELTMQTYVQANQKTPQDHAEKIMHSYLKNENMSFMAGDAPPRVNTTVGDNVHLSINGSDQTLLTEYFNKLSQGGSVQMPLEKQFWGDTFGMLTDKFGVHWMMNISAKK